MKKKIIILGSTGSVGSTTFNILKKDKKNFDVILLSTNSNVKKIIQQANVFKVKNIIINNNSKFIEAKKKYNNKNIKFFNNFEDLDKILKNQQIYYSMISVSGLAGLKPSTILPKYTKYLAIVNKESLICGWDIIKKFISRYNVNFLPIDSEHYSIFKLLKSYKQSDVEHVYITASGGPFLNYPLKKFKHIKPVNALKHPNWKMGKKITIDSSTLMNKVFEVIEAKNLFNIPYNKISILTHRHSYIHTMIKFKNGITKILIHDPDMKIPIFNSIYDNKSFFPLKKINFQILNNLSLRNVDKKKFPLVKLLNYLPENNSLYETILITINDFFVYKFLENKISFNKLTRLIFKTSMLKEFQKYKKIKPKKIDDIYKISEYVSLKLTKLSI